MSPRVTIGLPFRDARGTLAEAVRSVFAQTIDDWELILVDDGSTDGSLAIARSIEDPRVRVVADGQNLGLAARLNELARWARAPLLARMDADDLMLPDRLQAQAAAMDAAPGLEVLGALAIAIDRDGRPRGLRGASPPATQRELLWRGLFVHPTVMFRTRWARANPYSTDYPRAEDLELWVRTGGAAQVALLPRPLLLYREAAPLRIDCYAATQRSRRKILRRYGPTLVGGRRAGWMVAKTFAAEAITRLAAWCRRDEVLLRRRNRPLPLEAADSARALLARIRATRVPGLAASTSWGG